MQSCKNTLSNLYVTVIPDNYYKLSVDLLTRLVTDMLMTSPMELYNANPSYISMLIFYNAPGRDITSNIIDHRILIKRTDRQHFFTLKLPKHSCKYIVPLCI